MRSWQRCLDAAGVTSGTDRAAYLKAKQFMLSREPAGHLAVRLLIPARLQPHILAGYAFASFTDDLCDRGTVAERTKRYAGWAEQVRTALDTGSARHPLLRAFLHTAEARELPRSWVDSYLVGAEIDLDFAGFTTEDDYQAYIETLTWPFLMITSGLSVPGGGTPAFADSCRLLADACQRTDFLTDLAEDLGEGRLYLPTDDLEKHGVVRSDLERGRDLPGVRSLLSATAATAHATLREATRIIAELPEEQRPLTRFVILLHAQRLRRATAMGAAVTRRPVRDNPIECLRILAQAHRPSLAVPAPQTSAR
ncbi:phytoene/squalene synthase family protein [Streptomyces sp. WI04-05B]|uniref:phytoene/squalene synthase family protein n=1 Tax=Streptomyces TaxID=1883 RepID=UPI0029BBA95B|nr:MULTISPECIES: squalene/phytoene synthase family protein [unclassified Streptomyces]MDX2540580.1 squalene/phytoene synthase family protein [Streptomyces sp. WI04-05B]MDX2584988.1 squalene/phytoene synthase family protein [Streptomyces sp. WI04-05A]MDX3749256.1 squalene/phytoene synthase family protein [Streptomyces sp. AK08-02]